MAKVMSGTLTSIPLLRFSFVNRSNFTFYYPKKTRNRFFFWRGGGGRFGLKTSIDFAYRVWYFLGGHVPPGTPLVGTPF